VNLNFSKPYCGSAVGHLMKFLYGGKFLKNFEVLQIGGGPARVYLVDRIWPTNDIVGQTHGEMIFILKSFAGSPNYRNIQTHEFVHVWQSRQAGGWGLPFMAKYIWYLIRHGYQNNPYEVQARELASRYS